MHALLIFVLLLASVLIAGAALAWPVHTLLSLWFEPEFENVTSRTVLGLGILVFLAVFRMSGFRAWHEIGFEADSRQFWANAAKGFGAGILVMLPVVTGLLLVRNRVVDPEWDWSPGSLALLLATALIAGCIVSLIEESVFRGLLLSAIRRKGSVLLAVITTSFFYALVHFLRPGLEPDPDTLDWTSGFTLLREGLSALSSPIQYLDSFIALLAAGILLAVIRIRSGGLALCIGMHAGWVFTIKLFKRTTNSNDASAFAYLTGTYDHVIGYLAAVCLAVTILIYLKMRPG